ncbi:MAG: hypothetical protein JRF61_04840 [Deltaproteobacteria bacterium]|jgi:hypothetical protein|nr:hypothetical protein [Deltaproteobacteria bacterium]
MQLTPTHRRLLLMGLLMTGTLMLAGALAARDAGACSDRSFHRHRHGHSERSIEYDRRLRDARRKDRMLDHRGGTIDLHYDIAALFAAFAGDYALADALDRRGDRIERRYDRRGDRILRRARAQQHPHSRSRAEAHPHSRSRAEAHPHSRSRHHRVR